MKQPEQAAPNRTMYVVLAAIAAVGLIGGVIYYNGGFGGAQSVAGDAKADPDVSELMEPGPLPEMTIGSSDAPYTIVEYASMTCSHCAHFQTEVFPELKEKYIDTGKVRYILREFPLDNLAAAAFMLARCSGEDRYFPMVDVLFETQKTWAVRGAEAQDQLLRIARQAGISKEQFDKCLADKELFEKIVQVRNRAHEQFKVASTPTFFINGKRLQGDHKIENFQVALGEKPAAGEDEESEEEGTASQ